MKKTIAILLAAGKSERFGNRTEKPFLTLKGKAIYRYSLDVLMQHPQVDSVLLVLPKNKFSSEKELLEKEKLSKPIDFVMGGETRFESVLNALKKRSNSPAFVLIHDAARPLLTSNLINNCLDAIENNKAVSCAIQSTDTLAEIEENNQVVSFPNRKKIMQIQTPQIFQISLLEHAFSLALKDAKTEFTDESSLIHHYHLAPIFLVAGSAKNLKITFPSDLLLVEHFL
ncbi:MAG: 2-C-methyl-D-erythritol 4-phosphate cytidylyltransferase [Bacteroidales bacterium]|nr:2-C-methyl-D-erythritol 4-phosphate cytidylyltransferase [Bacteroidales bacterium]